jgi:hypothetical protein
MAKPADMIVSRESRYSSGAMRTGAEAQFDVGDFFPRR